MSRYSHADLVGLLAGETEGRVAELRAHFLAGEDHPDDVAGVFDDLETSAGALFAELARLAERADAGEPIDDDFGEDGDWDSDDHEDCGASACGDGEPCWECRSERARREGP